MTACTTRMDRLCIPKDPSWLDMLPARRGLWSESEADTAQRLVRAACEKQLLEWVWLKLNELSEAQRSAIQFHYFSGMPLRYAGILLQRSPSTVMRAEKRAIRALRAMYRADPSLGPTVACYRKGECGGARNEFL